RLLKAAEGGRGKPGVQPAFPGATKPGPGFPATAPRPDYRDQLTRELSEQAEKLRKEARDLRLAGANPGPIAAVEQRLLELKRQLRDGPRLKGGDCLSNRYLLVEEL